MPTVTVIEFDHGKGPYRTGDRAGFDPAIATAYVRSGAAHVVVENVPSIDPSVQASDAQRRLDEVRAMLTRAERDARAVEKAPGAAATAAEALAGVQAARASLAALERQLGEAGPLSAGDSRKPDARARAA